MSIRVISSVSANTGSVASSAALTAAEAPTSDFAALLLGQTTLAAADIALAESPSGPGNSSDKPGAANKDTETSGGELLDPSIIAAMLGIPPTTTAVTTQINTDVDANGKTPLAGTPDPLGGSRLSKALIDDAAPANSGLGTTTQEIDTDRQISSLLNDAANIAADPSDKNAAPSFFQIAMNHAALPQEKIPPTQTSVSAHLSNGAWPEQFGEKIVWLAKNDQQSAQINITPPQLGPIQITLNLNGDQANAIFASPHPEVRQAIEAALPQLREMLSAAGISLGDANVGANLAQQNQNSPFPNANRTPSGDENAILPANEKTSGTLMSQALQRGRGMVDLFA